MKRSFLLVPAILVVLFLLNSFFVLKGDEAKKNPIKEGKSFSKVKLAPKGVTDPSAKDSEYRPSNSKSVQVNIVYKSVDGGQTWQDISAGLPFSQQLDRVREDNFFANDSGLYLSAGDGIYRSEPNSTTGSWEKEASLYKAGSIAPGKSGIFTYTYEGRILQKRNGTAVWSPMYANFKGNVHTVFETAGGTVFIASHNGLFKSANSGKTWNQVYAGRCIMKLAESNGVLLASSNVGILRSSDGGENWDKVISEGGVGIAVEPINGGFAAIAYNTTTKTRRIHLSTDGGKTWRNPLGEGPQSYLSRPLLKQGEFQPSMNISSIKQVGKYLIIGHPDGILRSSDMGKTWKLLLPSIEDKVFTLSVSGSVVYAIATDGGC